MSIKKHSREGVLQRKALVAESIEAMVVTSAESRLC